MPDNFTLYIESNSAWLVEEVCCAIGRVWSVDCAARAARPEVFKPRQRVTRVCTQITKNDEVSMAGLKRHRVIRSVRQPSVLVPWPPQGI